MPLVLSRLQNPLCARKTNLLDVLALELSHELAETLVVSVDADGGKDTLDIVGRGSLVAGEGEEEVSGEVLHFEWASVMESS